MRSVVVVRCPKCGSTDAGEDPLDPGAYELTRMKCNTCGHNELADHYLIKDDWNVDIEIEDDATELPKFRSCHAASRHPARADPAVLTPSALRSWVRAGLNRERNAIPAATPASSARGSSMQRA